LIKLVAKLTHDTIQERLKGQHGSRRVVLRDRPLHDLVLLIAGDAEHGVHDLAVDLDAVAMIEVGLSPVSGIQLWII
jgi:hypothetical protein